MISNESELKDDVREMTGYKSVKILSNDGLDTAYRSAKRHIRINKGLDPEFEWYSTDNRAGVEALFWFTCLFSKVQTGELDSQSLQAGAINANSLLAKDNNQVTTWYRNATASMKSLNGNSIIRASSPSRTGREYEAGTFGEQSGSSSTEVDGSDL